MVDSCCDLCGVAFNVGAKRCNEKDCIKPNTKPNPQYRASKYDQTKLKFKYVQEPAYSRLKSIEVRAKKKNMPMELTQEFLSGLLKSPCVYCLIKCNPEVDRKNNSLGYTMDNCVPACRRCNTIKNDHCSYDEMIKVATLMGWRQ